MTKLAESHAHLQEPEFEADLEAVLRRAREADVQTIVVPGVDAESSDRAAALTEQDESVWAAAGYHPHEAESWTATGEARIEELLAQPKVVAVGEIGLDFFRPHSGAEYQVRVLIRMLALAERSEKPVSIHCRDAWNELRTIVPGWAEGALRSFEGRPLGVLYYFSGSLEEAEEYAQLGCMISIHTSVTHPKAESTRQVAAGLPLASIVLETDSPYGAPQAHRGQRNEPSFLQESVKEIARLRNLPEDELATSANVLRLFGLPQFEVREAAI